MAEMGETVHTTTVAWDLHQSNLYGRVSNRKSLLNKAPMKSQLEFARRHVGDSDVKSKEVLWSAETKMLLFGHQTRHYVSRTPNPAHHQTHMPCCGDVSLQQALDGLLK